jgi:hypothetical protein
MPYIGRNGERRGSFGPRVSQRAFWRGKPCSRRETCSSPPRSDNKNCNPYCLEAPCTLPAALNSRLCRGAGGQGPALWPARYCGVLHSDRQLLYILVSALNAHGVSACKPAALPAFPRERGHCAESSSPPCACSFKTLINPGAADEYAKKSRRGGGGGGSGGGGYGGGRPPPRGPRVTGLSDLRDASGSESCFFLLGFALFIGLFVALVPALHTWQLTLLACLQWCCEALLSGLAAFATVLRFLSVQPRRAARADEAGRHLMLLPKMQPMGILAAGQPPQVVGRRIKCAV